MFDIERAIYEWKAPFTQRHIYSGQDISELEMHLRDVIADERLWGATDEEAFRSAVQRVGEERVLRADYQLSWHESAPLKRYFKSLWNERVFLDGRASRTIYSTARLYSIVFGLASLFWFVLVSVRVFILWLKIPGLVIFHDPYNWVLMTATALSGWFCVAPFRRWTGSSWDWIRMSYAVLVLLLLSHYIVFVSPTYQLDVLYDLAALVSISIGPMMWLFRVLSPQEHVYQDAEMSIATPRSW